MMSECKHEKFEPVDFTVHAEGATFPMNVCRLCGVFYTNVKAIEAYEAKVPNA